MNILANGPATYGAPRRGEAGLPALAGLRQHIATLVHPDARGNIVERTHHEIFIGSRLAISLIAIALSPLFLAFGGAPAMWQAIAFSWMLLPVVAVAVLSRTGKLIPAQMICAVSILGLSMTFAAGGGMAAALAWLVLVPVEAALSMNFAASIVSTVAAVTSALALMLARQFDLLPGGIEVNPFIYAAVLVPGIIYAGSLSYLMVTMHTLHRQIEIVRAARFHSLSEVIGDVVLRHDRFGAVVAASPDSEKHFGVGPSELMGRGFFERVHVADRPAFLKAISDAAAWGEPVAVELRLRVRDGGPEPVFAWFELRARRFDTDLRIPGETGEAAVVAVVRDVTASKAHAAAIEAARADAERTSLWKDRFLANVSHELRTPLNAIIGFSEMLGSEELSPRDPKKQREYADIIHASGQHLLSVVNTILDMSKIEAGSFEILSEPFEMTRLIDMCCDMVRLKAGEGDVTLVKDYPGTAMEEIVGDKRACKQILINLLSNAVKFTPRGGRVTVRLRPDGNSQIISVSDTGIGILPRDLPRLGDPFFQATSSYDRPYEGTGLGLSVVRGLVGLHGGDIKIESAHGQGTHVHIRLPLDCRHAPALKGNGAPIKTSVIALPVAAFPQFPSAMVKKSA